MTTQQKDLLLVPVYRREEWYIGLDGLGSTDPNVLKEWLDLVDKVCAFLGPDWVFTGMDDRAGYVAILKNVYSEGKFLYTTSETKLYKDVLVAFAGAIPNTPELLQEIERRAVQRKEQAKAWRKPQ